MYAQILGNEKIDGVDIERVQERDINLIVRLRHGAEPGLQIGLRRLAYSFELFELPNLTEGDGAALGGLFSRGHVYMPLGRPTEIQKLPRTACDLATLLWREQLWKRKFAARDFRPNAPEMSRGDGRKDSADRLTPPQAAGMSCYSVAEEIIPGRADFLVELRGFEPCAFESKAQLVVPEKNCNSRCFLIRVARRITTLCCRERSIVGITTNQLSEH
jgi:hypothetical protein